jgi:hypothetical protein
MKAEEDDDIRPDYDFSNAVRGKYFERYQAGTNIVLLDSDVAAAFPDSDAVNEALRSLLRIAQRATGSSRG